MSSLEIDSSNEDVERPAIVSNYLPAPLQIDWYRIIFLDIPEIYIMPNFVPSIHLAYTIQSDKDRWLMLDCI